MCSTCYSLHAKLSISFVFLSNDIKCRITWGSCSVFMFNKISIPKHDKKFRFACRAIEFGRFDSNLICFNPFHFIQEAKRISFQTLKWCKTVVKLSLVLKVQSTTPVGVKDVKNVSMQRVWNAIKLTHVLCHRCTFLHFIKLFSCDDFAVVHLCTTWLVML